jgi:hypothetical protein
MFLARLFRAVFLAIAMVAGLGVVISIISVVVVTIRHNLGF